MGSIETVIKVVGDSTLSLMSLKAVLEEVSSYSFLQKKAPEPT
jgi:hypothetical protein